MLFLAPKVSNALRRSTIGYLSNGCALCSTRGSWLERHRRTGQRRFWEATTAKRNCYRTN